MILYVFSAVVQARTEQASAVARAAAAEETAMQAAEELGAMRDAVQDLRERLHQASLACLCSLSLSSAMCIMKINGKEI